MQSSRRWPRSMVRAYSPELLWNGAKDLLGLCGPFSAIDCGGIEWHVAGVFVKKADTVARMRIHMAHESEIPPGRELWMDVIFLSKAFEILRRAGYEGVDFFGGDIRHQSSRFVVLNPHEHFDAFAVDRGFQRLI